MIPKSLQLNLDKIAMTDPKEKEIKHPTKYTPCLMISLKCLQIPNYEGFSSTCYIYIYSNAQTHCIRCNNHVIKTHQKELKLFP